MNDIYSIIKRHDEIKNANVWAVRIKPIAYSEEFLAKLKDFAKALHGSYKSFEGARRFVFKTEGEANDFCRAIMECVGTVSYTHLTLPT